MEQCLVGTVHAQAYHVRGRRVMVPREGVPCGRFAGRSVPCWRILFETGLLVSIVLCGSSLHGANLGS